MKNTLYTLLISCSFILMISSCGEDYLTKEIPFEDIGFEPTMVLNSKFTSSSDDLLVSISKNINYANSANSDFELIGGVELTLEIDGTEISAVPYEDIHFGVFNYIFILDNQDIVGKSLTIKGSHADYPDIIATTKLESIVRPTKMKFEKRKRKYNDFGYIIDEDLLTVTIDDDPNAENYYFFQVIRKTEIDTILLSVSPPDTFFAANNVNTFYTRTDDISDYEVYPSAIAVSDRAFNGQQVKIELYTDSDYSSGDEGVTLQYKNISKSEFNFARSYKLYEESQDFGLFTEPTTLYNNVEGGAGIFSIEETFYYSFD